MKTKKFRRGLLLLILVLQLANLIWFGMQKQGFHEDELYTYYSSNRTVGLFHPDGEWQDAETIRKEFTVQPGETFAYGLIAQVQSWDVHPPLYYDIFHTICALTPGVFTRWSGIATNMIAFVLCFLLLNLLIQTMLAAAGEGETEIFRMQLLISVIWGFHPLTVSCVMFIRMYMWLTVFVLLCAWLHLRWMVNFDLQASSGEYSGAQKRRYFATTLLPIMLCSTLGFLTQYYYLVFFVLLGGLFTLWMFLKRKPMARIISYVVGCALSLGIAVALYPASARHILRGYRGKEAVEAFASAANLQERMIFFFGLLNEGLFGGFGLVLLMGAMVLLAVIWYRRQHNGAVSGILREMCLVLTGAVILYFLLIAKTALLLGKTSHRYEMPVYPLIILLVVLGVRTLLKRAALPVHVLPWAILVITLAVEGADLYGFSSAEETYGAKAENVLFLYPEMAEQQSLARDNQDTAVLILYNEATPENIWRLGDVIMAYPKCYYLSEQADPDAFTITDDTIKNADRLLIYAADHEHRDELIRAIRKETSLTEPQEVLAQRDMWTLYSLK